MQLLEDVFIIEQLQVINEGKAGTGPMKVRGIFQRADEANNNKRIYRKPLLEREITKLADAMTERRLMGELDHPQHDSVKLSNVSHLITGLSMKGNEVIGEAEILNTPAGKVAQALIDGGVKIGISSRGMGTVTEELDGKRYVNEDFKLITWDIVADPSTRGAFPGLTESTQIQEIIDTVYPEAQKVKNFTTLLKEELVVETKKIGTTVDALARRHRVKMNKDALAAQKDREGVHPFYDEGGWERRIDRDPHGLAKRARRGGAADYHGENLVWRKRDAIERLERMQRMQSRRSSQNSSTQFVNFMRDKLNEKTRWQKEAEKRAKPSGSGRVATFQTMSGSRRGSKHGMIPDLTPAQVRSYKAASTPGGLGKKAAAAADAGSKSPAILRTLKRPLRRDAKAILSLRTARATLRRGKDSTEAFPIAHKGGENRNRLSRGMPVLKRVEDKLKSGKYRG